MTLTRAGLGHLFLAMMAASRLGCGGDQETADLAAAVGVNGGAGVDASPGVNASGGTNGSAGASGSAGTTGSADAGGGSGSVAADAGVPMTSLGCGASKWPASGHFSIDVDGTERTYIVEIPKDYNPSTSYKLVFAWHGFTITAEQVASPIALGNLGRFFVLEPRAQGTAIFVAPQGLDTMLLGQVGPGWDNLNGRDVAFARAMLDSLRASYCIDDARIFSAGVSMGGYFSNQLGCEMGDVFRAVASIIGGGPILLGGPQCKGPMPAWITHGNMDQINPFSQGVASRDYWAKANHCSTMTTPVGPAGCVAYEGCDASYPVHFCEFDGNHMIPDFAAEGMWNFFSQF